MKIRYLYFQIVLLLLLLLTPALFAQGKPYEGPDDPAGDLEAIREGTMDGNRIICIFRIQPSWPNGQIHIAAPNGHTGPKGLMVCECWMVSVC